MSKNTQTHTHTHTHVIKYISCTLLSTRETIYDLPLHNLFSFIKNIHVYRLIDLMLY